MDGNEFVQAIEGFLRYGNGDGSVTLTESQLMSLRATIKNFAGQSDAVATQFNKQAQTLQASQEQAAQKGQQIEKLQETHRDVVAEWRSEVKRLEDLETTLRNENADLEARNAQQAETIADLRIRAESAPLSVLASNEAMAAAVQAARHGALVGLMVEHEGDMFEVELSRANSPKESTDG